MSGYAIKFRNMKFPYTGITLDQIKYFISVEHPIIDYIILNEVINGNFQSNRYSVEEFKEKLFYLSLSNVS